MTEKYYSYPSLEGAKVITFKQLKKGEMFQYAEPFMSVLLRMKISDTEAINITLPTNAYTLVGPIVPGQSTKVIRVKKVCILGEHEV